MKDANRDGTSTTLKEIIRVFLKLGATAYGGPAIMGIMQSELQEKRQWISKERFVEGLALVNTLPGPGATQLAIFLGHARAGWRGGVLAGLCLMLPAFFVMLALTIGYATYGATPLMNGALYGLGPVVIGIFLVAIYRLGRAVVTTIAQMVIALGAALGFAQGEAGIVALLAVAGGFGVLLFHSKRLGAIILGIAIAVVLVAHFAPWPSPLRPQEVTTTVSTPTASLFDIGSFFVVVGGFSFGGGLSMIAFIQERVVEHYHWLTQREFIDGLALGQVTPGPILMVSAYVGYKLAGILGALVATVGTFLPSFVVMLSILPVFDRVRDLAWTKGALKGIGPAVIGVLSVSLFRMTPYAVPDLTAAAIFIGTVVALMVLRIGAIKLVLLGALVGALRKNLPVAHLI